MSEITKKKGRGSDKKKDLNIPENAGKKQAKRDKKGRFLPGASGNPDGKKKGTLSFKTKWELFIKKIAEQNNILPKDIDDELIAVAYQKARGGDYKFFKDIHDRVYGKPQESIDHTTDGEKIQTNQITFVKFNKDESKRE
ncbi:hypothetical protein DRQ25_00950 [Candidatus Fermentibacteria bacterium]|nr:MAG: hypothetical protein DRQ25_00950 [Candidatus Fermentibacteria bacterium]